MNVEQILRTALADEVAAVEPSPGGWERISRRARRRTRTWLAPVTAAATVLALVAAAGVVLRRDGDGPVPLARPARTAADLYLPEGSVWPLQSESEAEAWRSDRGSAPYLADPEETAASFVRSALDGLGDVTPAEDGADRKTYLVLRSEGDRTRVTAEIVVARRPGESGPWVVVSVGQDVNNGWPRHWLAERTRRISSPVDVAIVPVNDRYVVEVAQLTADGRYDVLGRTDYDEQPPDGIGFARVTFRAPSAGFGVIAVRGYDAAHNLVQTHYLPASFDDPWPPP